MRKSFLAIALTLFLGLFLSVGAYAQHGHYGNKADKRFKKQMQHERKMERRYQKHMRHNHGYAYAPRYDHQNFCRPIPPPPPRRQARYYRNNPGVTINIPVPPIPPVPGVRY
jgi:hypothetical protein